MREMCGARTLACRVHTHVNARNSLKGLPMSANTARLGAWSLGVVVISRYLAVRQASPPDDTFGNALTRKL